MNFQDARIILEVMKTRNISKAAENLFLAQSTISTRIQQVEEELNCQLFYRQKGQRHLELTSAGKEFLPIARHIQTISEQVDLLRENFVQELRLASNESFFYEVLQPYCEVFLKEHPRVRLSIQVKDSSEVYQLVGSAMADLGFGSYQSGHRGVKTEPVYDQHWCVVSGEELPDRNGIVSPDCLDIKKECFYNAGDLDCIYRWRHLYLNSSFAGTIQTNSFIESLGFVQSFGCWEFATRLWAEKMQSFGGYHIYDLETPPKYRTIYEIRPDQQVLRPIDQEFEAGLREWISAL